jgi:hypothetical protein
MCAQIFEKVEVKVSTVLPWDERRTVSRDEFYAITSRALPRQFIVL